MKAQGLSVRTVIIAALALIVLIVLVAIFTGRIRIFSGGARNCATQGGKYCAPLSTGCGDYETGIPGTDCIEQLNDNTALCCVPLLNT
jgi:hypothetical protein